MPDWEYRLWGDADLPKLAENMLCPELVLDESIGMGIRPDVLRFEILRQHGGIYLDHDMEVFRPLDEILVEDCMHFGFDLPGLASCGTAILASPEGHPFWEFYLRRIRATVKPERPADPWAVLNLTGPAALRRAIHEWLGGNFHGTAIVGEKDVVLGHIFEHGDLVGWSREAVFPYHISEHNFAGYCPGKYPQAYAAHHWQGEWFREDAEAKRTART